MSAAAARSFDRRPSPPLPPMAGRAPPSDLDAEAAVISAMLLSRESIPKVRGILRAEQCYSSANTTIVEVIYELHDVGSPVDIVSVASRLREHEKLAQCGGPSYLAQLAEATPSVAHVETHALIVVGWWMQREAGKLGHTLAAEHYGDVGDRRQWIARAQAKLAELGEHGRTHTEEHVRPVLARVINETMALADQGKRSLGVLTGYKEFDKATAGLFPGRVTYIAARPGVGKSSLARNIALNVAGRDDVSYGVIFIQLEGNKEQVAQGMLCSEAKVDGLKLAGGMLQPDDWRSLTEAGAWLSALPIWIEDRPCTVDDIIAIVMRKQAEFNRPATATTREQKVFLVVLDYVQRVRADVAKDKRSEELARVSLRLSEDVAKGCGVHVLALAAMNRDVEKRKGGRPQLSDLRDCGDLESDADAVIFLDRPPGEDPGDDRRGGKPERSPDVATATFGKNRFGPSPTFKLRFFGSYFRFADLYEGPEPQ